MELSCTKGNSCFSPQALAYHIFPLVRKYYCKVKPNTRGSYCSYVQIIQYKNVRWSIDRAIRWHHFCQVRISEDYKSYHAVKKLLEKVSNLSKLSLINQTYKYELAYRNKNSHLTTFQFVYYGQFKTLNSKFTFIQWSL